MDFNRIYQGNALEVLKTFPKEVMDCVMTSPPYWALRNYGDAVGSVWDLPNILHFPNGCDHEWGEHLPGKRSRWGDLSTMSEKQASNRGSEQMVGALESPSGQICKKCGAWKGQLGLEPTPELYVKHLCDIFDEVKRVLKKDGTVWVNIGDTYSSQTKGDKRNPVEQREKRRDGVVVNSELCFGRHSKEWFGAQHHANKITKVDTGISEKSLCMIPFKFAMEMVNRGWILRNTIIWHKPNCMPSSIKDRFTVDFEYVFFFVKNRKYFFETQYEPHTSGNSNSVRIFKPGTHGYEKLMKHEVSHGKRTEKEGEPIVMKYGLHGRNKRCVWSISTRAFKDAHFATYPERLCEIPIKAGCPQYVCNKCGKPRQPIYESQFKQHSVGATSGQYWQVRDFQGDNTVYNSSIKTGYTDCGCGEGFSGGVVLDPFFGAGTTGVVALKQGKRFVGIELNPEYIKIAEKRLKPELAQQRLI